jgi:hypothetical protein
MATKLTKQQQQSLVRLWKNHSGGLSYRQLRRTVRPELYGSAVMVRWAGMWIGIEPDGYAHS